MLYRLTISSWHACIVYVEKILIINPKDKRFPNNKSSCDVLFQEKLLINLIASTASTTALIGVADISLAEVLIFPQNKIQLTTKVMSTSSDCDHKDRFCACDVKQSKPKHLGNLTLWFRLTCELDILKSLYNNTKQWSPQNSHQSGIHNFEENNEEPNSITAHEETIQDTVQSPGTQECPDEQSIMPKPLITLTIIGLRLNNDFKGDEAKQIYVEYSFLQRRRLKSESRPMSTNDLIFNFKQKFYRSDRNIERLTQILKDPEQSIKLRINTRSANESENNCTEIGFGLLHLGKCLNEESVHDVTTPYNLKIAVLSKQPPYQNIGYLDICIEDIQSLERLQSNLK